MFDWIQIWGMGRPVDVLNPVIKQPLRSPLKVVYLGVVLLESSCAVVYRNKPLS
jgi:hypothetical protein